MMLAECNALFAAWLMVDSPRPAAVCHATLIHDRVPLHLSAIYIGVVHVDVVHANHRSVVQEIMSVPSTAHKADTHISKSVVHATVIANVRSPVAGMEHI